jgi:hypothetical protein
MSSRYQHRAAALSFEPTDHYHWMPSAALDRQRLTFEEPHA